MPIINPLEDSILASGRLQIKLEGNSNIGNLKSNIKDLINFILFKNRT